MVSFVAGARDFSLHANAQTESETHTASHSVGTRGSSVAVNRLERDVNHLSSSRAEGQNEWSYTYVRLQCINRGNNASALCKLRQVEAAITIIFLFSPPKGTTFFVPAPAREISGKRASSWRCRKAAEFGTN